MNSSDLRRKNTVKGRPLRILSLDGGGVRGYSMLVLLREFMLQTYYSMHPELEGRDAPDQDNYDVDPKPCEYFDLIAGTGTGGLIAIMLGRLRMRLVDCMRVYVDMTKKVFETDKTIAGIPYRSTLFKASKLEEAIQECVRRYEIEENSQALHNYSEMPTSPARPGSIWSGVDGRPSRSLSFTSRRQSSVISPVVPPNTGHSNAYLYDSRPDRTKTAVTAVYKGTGKGGTPALLRSYRSRKKPPPEYKCTIWQAGRATCATKLAFKPIQLGQSIFLDEGYGMINLDKSPTYNPAPQILDEAVMNEWPGREVGVFLSIGTGKRPGGTNSMQSEWWEGFAGGLGDFAEAKRKLILKIEGCEKTHEDMLSTHLPDRSIPQDHYFRLNVEVGVGEFGMNEWNRLADIRNSTELYLNRADVKKKIETAAQMMADIEQMSPYDTGSPFYQDRQSARIPPLSVPPPSNPEAVELPGENLPLTQSAPSRDVQRLSSYPYSPQSAWVSEDKSTLLSTPENPQLSDQPNHRLSQELPAYPSNDVSPGNQSLSASGSIGTSPRRSYEAQAPPIPPKTPIGFSDWSDMRKPFSYQMPNNHPIPPYPDDDGPPPAVNMARKPEFVRR